MTGILQIILIGIIVTSIYLDINRIQTNREVKESNEKLYEIIKERNKQVNYQSELIDKIKKNLGELNQSLSIDYDKLTEEVIKRINRENREENING